MKTKKLEALSFEDTNGATITVPTDQLAIYSTLKSDQLNVVNRILADHAGGFKVEFDANTISALAGLAGELAYACNEFMCHLSGALYTPKVEGESKVTEGGA